MNNLTFAVIAIAVAQSLTILLTIGRDREIKKLREIVAQQRIFISEIKGWLLRERIELAQPRRKNLIANQRLTKSKHLKSTQLKSYLKSKQHLKSYLESTHLKSKHLRSKYLKSRWRSER